MSNPERYFVEERRNGTFAVKGQGNERASRVVTTEAKAESSAHHLAERVSLDEFRE
jgi:hypothetical protein